MINASKLSQDLGSTVTEITAVKCVLPYSLIYLCAPGTTPADDAKKGKWVRVDQDLNFPAGYFSVVCILN